MGYYQAQGDYYGRRAMVGDPFLGGLLGVVGRLAPKLVSKIPVVGRIAGRIFGGGATKAIPALPRIAGRIPTIAKRAAAIAGAGAAFEVGARAVRVDPVTGLPIRSRRMNVTNVKALRRSIRRVQGFQRMAVRTGLVRRPVAKAGRRKKR